MSEHSRDRFDVSCSSSKSGPYSRWGVNIGGVSMPSTGLITRQTLDHAGRGLPGIGDKARIEVKARSECGGWANCGREAGIGEKSMSQG